MSRKLAISDIHGCYHTFKYMVEERLRLSPNDVLYLLGDYIDRGPGSRQTIDYIIALQEAGYMVKTLRGNHEEMMLNAFYSPSQEVSWRKNNGGLQTLHSFGIKNLSEIPEKYYHFLHNLDWYYELNTCWLVHAGFNIQPALMFTDRYSMLWSRKHGFSKSLMNNKIVIHGHTSTAVKTIKEQAAKSAIHHISIDAGCVMYRNPDKGHLCAINLDTLELIFEPNREPEYV